MKIPITSKIANEIEYLYKKILLRHSRQFEIEHYLRNLENGKLQFSDIEKSLKNSIERKHIDTLNQAKDEPIKTKDGIGMHLDHHDYAVSAELCVYKIWEPFETLIFKKFIKKNTIFIDIGAHIGYYSLLCASKATKGKIFAFEPVPQNFNLLQKNIILNGLTNIEPIQKAVSNQNNNVSLFLSNDSNTGDNRFFGDSVFGKLGEQKSIKVSCLKLDDFFKEYNILPNVIKMDIQGAESLALKGMKNTLQNVENLILFTEFWPKGIISTGESPQEFLETVNEYGFKIFEIDEQNRKLIKKSITELISIYTDEKNPDVQTDLLLLKNIQEPKLN